MNLYIILYALTQICVSVLGIGNIWPPGINYTDIERKLLSEDALLTCVSYLYRVTEKEWHTKLEMKGMYLCFH